MYDKTSYRLGVRTLVFQSNNAGSNPASLILKYNFNYKTVVQSSKKHKLNYSLKFTSLISPSTITNLSLLESTTNGNEKHKKLLVKQSYILLIWILYLKGKYSNFDDNQQVPSFFVHKKSRYKTTKLKTPMAHKTFSQEQFIFKHYTIVVSFKVMVSEQHVLESINDALFVILSIRDSIPFFNTNLLFLKRINFSFSSSDNSFFKFY